MLRKRTIIAIIITVATIVATNKLWLIFKPMPIDFDIKGQGQCNIEVLLNKKDNDKFDKIKTQSITLDLNKNNHASFNIKRARYPKRIKIIISGLENNSPIEISNITLRNGKYKLDDLIQFTNSGENISIKHNSLVTKPNYGIITLEYKKTLNVRTTIKFDFKLFVIILILTYLLAYKLANYVADFKSVKEKSRIDIIFLTIFFIFLFIPMSHINYDEISVQENRTLAKWQPFITQDGEINYDFGKNFNEWFNDRFYLRNFFIKRYNILNYYVTDIYIQDSKYFNKKNNWAFNSNWISTKNLDYNFERYKENILKLNNFCKKNNIQLYILILPSKGEVYSKEFIEMTGITNIINNGENFSKYMNSNGINFVISPLTELKNAAKNEYVYSKGDVHWNQAGGVVAYKSLMKHIKKDFNNIEEIDLLDYQIINSKYSKTDYNNFPTNGNLYRELFIPDKKLDVNYKNYVYKHPENITRLTYKNLPEEIAYAKVDNDITVYYIGNSYEECLIDFIIPTFKKTIKRRYNTIPPNTLSFSRYKEDIINQKPNILILQTLSFSIDDFIDLY